MAERKRRTDEHRRADVAVKVVQLAIARAGHVSIVGEQGSDYGTDLSVQTFDEAGYLGERPLRRAGEIDRSADRTGRWPDGHLPVGPP